MSLVYPTRLLDTQTLKLVKGRHDYKYAILSHRWVETDVDEELTFRQLQDTDLNAKFPAKYGTSQTKHINACRLAAGDGWKYLWADTVCINKDSSEELRKSLNAMFDYYRQAEVCYSYLNDVDVGGAPFASQDPNRRGHPSVWFTRGWTLQELLAPRRMEFFNRQWQHIGARQDRELLQQIAQITGIAPIYLQGTTKELNEASVATKLSWMAGRVTGEVEDIAYGMIGLLRISMIPKYGEGIQAFQSLQAALISAGNSFDESLFAWETPGTLECYYGAKFDKTQWGLLAPSPDCFKGLGNLKKAEISPRSARAFTCSNQGIVLSLPWKETRSWMGPQKKAISFGLNCKDGQSQIVVELAKSKGDGRAEWKRINCGKLGVRAPKRITAKSGGIDQGSAAYEDVAIAQPTYDPRE